jgi:MAF protein
MKNCQLVLASTSIYRKLLLEKLQLPFITAKPDCKEDVLLDETPLDLVTRLAKLKATSCSIEKPSLIIGSDQVCVIDGQIVGKPHNRENAIQQLVAQSGKTITFLTGLAVYNNQTEEIQTHVDRFNVHFRPLTQAMIERYVDKEQPFDCAGSFKSEGLGIVLFDRLEGDDPNSLVGLPLISLITILLSMGVDVI